jgi:hypothetical protein
MVRRFAGPGVRGFVGALLVLGATVAPASAQPAPWEPERVTAGWVFTPAIAFGGLWDSNVTVENDPNDLNPEQSEWVGLVNPRGTISFNGRRARLAAAYSGRLEAYRTLDELTRYNQSARAEARYQMTPRLLFETRHEASLAPTTEDIDLTGLPFVRVGSRLVTSSGGFTAELTRRTRLTTGYAFQWISFDRDPRFARLRGGHQHSPSAELTYEISRRLDVGGSWVYRHASVDGGEEVFDTHTAAATAGYRITEATRVHAMAGVAHVAVSSTGETEFGPSYGAGMSHAVRQATFDAGYERSFVPSFGFGGMTASEEARVGVNVPFLQGRMYTAGRVTWRRNTPVLSTSFPIELTSWWTSGTVGYAVARWLRMEVFLTRTHQESSAQGNVDRTRVGVQFVTLKPVRIQ